MKIQVVFPRAIIFDWDDTLIENWGSIHAALNSTLISMGHDPWTFEKTKSNVRLSMRDSFPTLFGDKWEKASEIFMRHIKNDHLQHLNILEFVPELLKNLNQRKIYLGVVSNKNGDLLREQVAYLKWDKWFSRIVGANDAKRDKPHRAPIDLVLEGSGISAGKSVWFVGDAPSDMECAYNAGVSAVLLSGKANNQEIHTRYPPELTFHNARELLRFLKQTRGNRG